MCVTTFVRSAVEQYGYQCTVVADSVTTKDLPGRDGKDIPASVVHESHLSALSDYFASVVNNVNDIVDK
jgi:nicotinamidase-related amidase